MKRVWGLVLALVCVFSLAGCSPAPAEEEKWDLIPMVMVDGILYLDTGVNNTELRNAERPMERSLPRSAGANVPPPMTSPTSERDTAISMARGRAPSRFT